MISDPTADTCFNGELTVERRGRFSCLPSPLIRVGLVPHSGPAQDGADPCFLVYRIRFQMKLEFPLGKVKIAVRSANLIPASIEAANVMLQAHAQA